MYFYYSFGIFGSLFVIKAIAVIFGFNEKFQDFLDIRELEV